MRDYKISKWPYNAIIAAFKDSHDANMLINVDPDTLEDVLISHTSERTVHIMRDYYFWDGDKTSLSKTGEIYGIGKSRVQQIIQRGLRVIRFHIKDCMRITPEQRISLQRKLEIRDALLREIIANCSEDFLKQFDIPDDLRFPDDRRKCLAASVLKLTSVRAFNVLARSGWTLDEFLKASYDDILKLRGCGKETAKEICEASKNIGHLVIGYAESRL